MAKYQHVRPQRDLDHIPYPATTTKFGKTSKVVFIVPLICKECANKIKEVADNEGPESLKALFPLPRR